MLRAALLRAAASPWLRREVMRRPATRRIARRFVAGETPEDGLAVARTLAIAGRRVTLDYLGEDITSAGEARAAAAVVHDLLDALAAEGLPGGVSVKPTQLGLRIDAGLCRDLLAGIVDRAAGTGAHVTLDMEASDVTDTTVALTEELAGAGDVGCALQAYLHRTPGDVARLTMAGASLRLCKGAYAEPRTIAYRRRSQVDAAYADLAGWLLEHGRYPRLATHDHRLIRQALNTAARLRRPRDTFELQMLYGVRPSLQDALVRDGWRLCVYVPFGERWYPYFVRRLAERPANVLFFLRALRDT